MMRDDHRLDRGPRLARSQAPYLRSQCTMRGAVVVFVVGVLLAGPSTAAAHHPGSYGGPADQLCGPAAGQLTRLEPPACRAALRAGWRHGSFVHARGSGAGAPPAPAARRGFSQRRGPAPALRTRARRRAPATSTAPPSRPNPGASALADRDRLARLEQVELQQLAGPIDRPLIRAPRQIARAQLAQVVVEDRLRALVAELLDQLPDPLAGQARIAAQQPIDLVAERSSFDGRGGRR
jgi:hypothetical protein